MALTPDQDAYFRQKLGSGYDDFDAETRLTRLGGAGQEPGVVVEVLTQRLTDLGTKPDSYTVVGEYSESWGSTIKLLQAQLVDARDEATAAGLEVSGEGVYIQPPERVTVSTAALDTEEFLARGGRSRMPGGR